MNRFAVSWVSCACVWCSCFAVLSGCGDSSSGLQAQAEQSEAPPAAEAPPPVVTDGRSKLPQAVDEAWNATSAQSDDVLEEKLREQPYDCPRETVELVRTRYRESPVTTLNGEGDLPLSKQLTDRWRDWARDLLTSSYDQHGLRGAAWDGAARDFLEKVAGDYPFWNTLEDERNVELSAAGKQALDAGCRDPLVLYCVAGVIVATNRGEAQRYLDEAYASFRPTTYPALFRYFAALRLAAEVQVYGIDRQRVPGLLDEAGRESLYALVDGTYGDDNHQLQWRHLNMRANNEGTTRQLRTSLALLQMDEVDPWLKHLYLGDHCRDLAWQERGGGYNYTVSAEKARRFGRYMTDARSHLAEAWRLRPDYTEAPQKLIEICDSVGGVGRETARFWFDRAVEAQFNNESAYSTFMFHLRPRWGGSHDKMLEFGRECMATKRYDTDVPFMFCRAVYGIRDEQGAASEIYSRPETYEGFKELYEGAFADPRAAQWKARYKAQYAVLLLYCGRPDEAQAILDEQGDQINHEGLVSMGTTLQELRDDIKNYREPDSKAVAVWPESMSAAAIAPDFEWMAVAGDEPPSLSIWSLKTSEPIAALGEILVGPDALAISPDGKQLASGGLDGRVSLWDLQTHQLIDELPAFFGRIMKINYSNDGSLLVAAGGDPRDSARPGHVVLWDVASRKLLARLDDHSHAVWNCVFAPDDRSLITAAWTNPSDSDGTLPRCEVFVWNVEQRRIERKLDVFDAQASTMTFSADGGTLAIGGFRQGIWKGKAQSLPAIEFIDTANYTSRQAIPLMAGALSLAFTSDGRYLLAGDMRGDVRVWNTTDGSLAASVQSQRAWITGLWLNEAAGQIHTTSSSSSRYCGLDLTPQGPAFYSEASLPYFTFPSSIEATALSRDGTRLATVSNFFDVRTWNLAPGKVARIHSPLALSGFDVAYSPDGKNLATATMDESRGEVRIFDADSGHLFKTLPAAAHCLRVAYSPDGDTLAAEGPGHTLEFWNWKEGAKWAIGAAGGMTGIGGIGFSPDGKSVATTSYDGLLRLWKVPARGKAADGSPVSIGFVTSARVPESTKPGRVEFSRDGKWLVYANTIETVVADSATLVERFRVRGGFFGIAPDGSYLATAGGPLSEIEACLWDLNTGREIRAFRGGHKEMILSAWFSPDSSRLITAGRDRRTRMWDVATGEQDWEMPWLTAEP